MIDSKEPSMIQSCVDFPYPAFLFTTRQDPGAS